MTTCAVVAAGPQFNAEAFLAMHAAGEFDCVIAVDGGFAHLERAGVVPNLVMGDFDSLGYVPRGLQVAKFPAEKDESDTELALSRARALGHERIFAFGMLGGRPDHALANMQVLAGTAQAGAQVCAVDSAFAIHFLAGPGTFEAPARMSGTVSVFSLTDVSTGVFERGLKWELDGATLTNSKSRGLSNELCGRAVMIGVEKGTLAVFWPL